MKLFLFKKKTRPESTLPSARCRSESTPSYYDQVVQPFSGFLNPYANMPVLLRWFHIASLFLITMQR